MFLFSFCPAARRVRREEGRGGKRRGVKRVREGAVDAAATYRPTPHSSPCSPTTNNPSVFSLPIYKQSDTGFGPAYRGARARLCYQCVIGTCGNNIVPLVVLYFNSYSSEFANRLLVFYFNYFISVQFLNIRFQFVYINLYFNIHITIGGTRKLSQLLVPIVLKASPLETLLYSSSAKLKVL